MSKPSERIMIALEKKVSEGHAKFVAQAHGPDAAMPIERFRELKMKDPEFIFSVIVEYLDAQDLQAPATPTPPGH
jgi:hypothetical protein